MSTIDVPISLIATPFALLILILITVTFIGLKVSNTNVEKGYFSRRYIAGIVAVIVLTALGYLFILGDSFKSLNETTKQNS